MKTNYFNMMPEHLILSNTTDLLRLSPIDILGIKAEGNYSIVYTTDGDEQLVLYQLGEVERKIEEQLVHFAPDFIRIGRCAIINFRYIYKINLPKAEITLKSRTDNKVTIVAPKEPLKALKQAVINLEMERRGKYVKGDK